MRLWDLMKASKGIPVSDPMARLWGYQYQQKHGVSEISGVPPLRFMSRGGYLQDYRIYGNTVQNGTPTPETPVEVQGMGEYDAELNGYKIPVTVSNGTNSITTPVYLGTEPLHKIDNYADYVDFKRGVVVRRIKKLALNGEENWTAANGEFFYTNINSLDFRNTASGLLCSHLPVILRHDFNRQPSIFWGRARKGDVCLCASNTIMSVSGFKAYLAAQYSAGTPVTIWYILAEPEEEPLENLLPIQTIKGTNILTADTTVQPSNIWIKGKIKAIN